MRILLTLPLVALLAGCGGGGADDAGSSMPAPAPPAMAETTPAPATTAMGGGGAQEVRIADFKYLPAQLTVKAGTKVTWTNEDSAPHNAIGEGLKTEDLTQAGQSDTVTLSKPGTYDYVCTFHPFMKGSVTVQ